eukprot:407078-Prymnesium_polylepis.1
MHPALSASATAPGLSTSCKLTFTVSGGTCSHRKFVTNQRGRLAASKTAPSDSSTGRGAKAAFSSSWSRRVLGTTFSKRSASGRPEFWSRRRL